VAFKESSLGVGFIYGIYIGHYRLSDYVGTCKKWVKQKKVMDYAKK